MKQIFKIHSIILLIIVVLILIFTIIYFIPTTTRAGLYNNFAERRGFGLWEIIANDQELRESEDAYLNIQENKIEILKEASCDYFDDLNLKIIIDDELVQQETIKCGRYKDNITFLGEKNFDGKEMKIVIESKIIKSIFSHGLIKGMKLSAYQTNNIIVKE